MVVVIVATNGKKQSESNPDSASVLIIMVDKHATNTCWLTWLNEMYRSAVTLNSNQLIANE